MTKILVTPSDLGANFNEQDAGAVVTELRRRGFTNVFTGEARPSRGEMSLADVFCLVRLVNEARAAAVGADWPMSPEQAAPPAWPGVMITVAARLGHAPLRVDNDTWRKWDIFERTASVYRYVADCITREIENDGTARRLTVVGSARLKRAVQAVLPAMEPADRIWLDYERTAVTERPGLRAEMGLNGWARQLDDESFLIEIDPEARSDFALLRTVAHELLHVARRHAALLRLVQNDEEFITVRAVFERQVDGLVHKLTGDAAERDYRL